MNNEEAHECRMRGWSAALWTLMDRMFKEDVKFTTSDVLSTVRSLLLNYGADKKVVESVGEAYAYAQESE